MENSAIINILFKNITDRYINVEEYQDKYYFKKEVQNIFPDLPDDIIYKAIDKANKLVKPPKKKIDFLKVLVKIISRKWND